MRMLCFMRFALNAMQVRAAKSGVGQYIHALVEAMLRNATEDEFTIYCSASNVENYRYPAPNLETRVWGISSPKSLRLLHQYAFLSGEIRRGAYDVFHGMSNFLPPFRACPYVVTIHDLSYYVHPERCPFVRRQYWYTMTARTVAVANAIITDSENSRKDIERFFPAAAGRIFVVSPAAHARFRKLEISREQSILAELKIDRPYVLFVGTLEPGKNIVRTIQAFDKIASEFPEHLLLLAGDRGWLYDEILAVAKSAGSADRIRMLGHVSDGAVVELLNFCDLFVFPSLYEGFGLPPLEAMQCGAPVVTSNTSSLPEVVGDAAITVSPDSVDEISRAMRLVLSDESLSRDLRRRGPDRARLFSWDRAAIETLKVYRDVASLSSRSCIS